MWVVCGGVLGYKFARETAGVSATSGSGPKCIGSDADVAGGGGGGRGRERQR